MTLVRFVGKIPELYDRHMGPVLFEPYAHVTAARLPRAARRVLEIAAGTGRVTRQLLAALPADGELVATDLNAPMIDEGRQRVPDARVHWQTADAQSLPFEDAHFDAVVCQFGLMFVPDQPLALREMRRVLRPGGTLLLATWDQLARNPASQQLHQLAYAEMPADPPAFMAVPFSLHDAVALHERIAAAGFASVRVDTVEVMGEAESASHLAHGFVRGNPLYTQLVDRGIDADAFEQRVAAALRARFGDAPCRSLLSAHVATAIA